MTKWMLSFVFMSVIKKTSSAVMSLSSLNVLKRILYPLKSWMSVLNPLRAGRSRPRLREKHTWRLTWRKELKKMSMMSLPLKLGDSFHTPEEVSYVLETIKKFEEIEMCDEVFSDAETWCNRPRLLCNHVWLVLSSWRCWHCWRLFNKLLWMQICVRPSGCESNR